MQRPTRRGFLAASAGAVMSASSRPVRLGAPIFLKSDDPRELAREHRRLGYSAAYCPRIASLENSALLAEVRKSFAAENVVIAEVGAWVNMLDPDAEKRRANLNNPSFASAPLLQKKHFPGPINFTKRSANRPWGS